MRRKERAKQSEGGGNWYKAETEHLDTIEACPETSAAKGITRGLASEFRYQR